RSLHRDLLPFPPRRAADLGASAEPANDPWAQAASPDTAQPPAPAAPAPAAVDPWAQAAQTTAPWETPSTPEPWGAATPPAPADRSEEHTSELQSREKHVCR